MPGEWRPAPAAARHPGQTPGAGDLFVVGGIAATHRARPRHGGYRSRSPHSWDHRRVHRFNPFTFRDHVCWAKRAGTRVRTVVGYRAPTFRVVRETAWAIDVLAEEGFRYDSSVFPVDTTGTACRTRAIPFWVHGEAQPARIAPTHSASAVQPAGRGGRVFSLIPPRGDARGGSPVRTAADRRDGPLLPPVGIRPGPADPAARPSGQVSHVCRHLAEPRAAPRSSGPLRLADDDRRGDRARIAAATAHVSARGGVMNRRRIFLPTFFCLQEVFKKAEKYGQKNPIGVRELPPSLTVRGTVFRLGVVARAVPVDDNHRFVADDPGIMPARQ